MVIPLSDAIPSGMRWAEFAFLTSRSVAGGSMRSVPTRRLREGMFVPAPTLTATTVSAITGSTYERLHTRLMRSSQPAFYSRVTATR